MKRFLFYTFLLLATVHCKAQATFDIISPILDVGKVPFDSIQVTASTHYTNNGNAPLYLTKAITFCPCTKVEFSSEALAPGDTGVVTITHIFQHLGPFQYAGRIYYFDPDDETASKNILIVGEALKKEEEVLSSDEHNQQ